MDLITRKRLLNSQNCSEDVQHNYFKQFISTFQTYLISFSKKLKQNLFGFVLFAAKYKKTSFYIL